MLAYIIFLSQGQQISSTEVVLADSQYQKTFCTATVTTRHLFLSLSHSLSHTQNLNLTFLFNSPYPFSASAVMLSILFPWKTHAHTLAPVYIPTDCESTRTPHIRSFSTSLFSSLSSTSLSLPKSHSSPCWRNQIIRCAVWQQQNSHLIMTFLGVKKEKKIWGYQKKSRWL